MTLFDQDVVSVLLIVKFAARLAQLCVFRTREAFRQLSENSFTLHVKCKNQNQVHVDIDTNIHTMDSIR